MVVVGASVVVVDVVVLVDVDVDVVVDVVVASPQGVRVLAQVLFGAAV